MIEKKWTPGPWVVNTPIGEDHPWIDAECNHTLNDNGVEQYMSVSGLCGMDNAHLIAAAPEMYEALDMCERLAGDLNIEEWKQVMDALAKARGDQSK